VKNPFSFSPSAVGIYPKIFCNLIAFGYIKGIGYTSRNRDVFLSEWVKCKRLRLHFTAEADWSSADERAQTTAVHTRERYNKLSQAYFIVIV